jgi:hypothetical protein
MADSEPFEPSPQESDELIGEELPDWLQEFEEEAPVETLEAAFAETVVAEPPVEEAVEVEAEAGDIIATEELPDWLRDVSIEEEEPTEEIAIQAEEMPVTVEPEPGPIAVAPEIAVEPVLATPAAGKTELPDWLKKLREAPQAPEQAPPPASQPVTPPMPQPAPVIAPEPAAVAAAAPSHLPADADKRLQLARRARERGNIEESTPIYESLIASGLHLDSIIEDMRQSTELYPANYMLYQLMGDAMMKDGRLQHALDAYRKALAVLSK